MSVDPILKKGVHGIISMILLTVRIGITDEHSFTMAISIRDLAKRYIDEKHRQNNLLWDDRPDSSI